MTAKLSVSSAWDEKLGVWVGERAAAPDMSELPDPLYILGYGSLIWRPGSLLENCKTYKCTALGSMRLFAQRSCDHRGTPDFPGLVLNLVQDDVLTDLGYRTKHMHRSEFRGLVWHVPKEAVSAVIEDLDYRERGGYHRHIIPVRLDADDDGEHTEVDALVYTGAPSNPNFYLPQSVAPDTTTDTTPSAEPTNCKHKKVDAFNLCKRNVMTDTIAAAVGPSGPNVDYLCNLEAFLSSNDMHDPFLTDLATSVRLRLGIWRGRLYRGASSRQTVKSLPSVGLTQDVLPYPLLGWGSNEFLQLSNYFHTPSRSDESGLLDHRYQPTLLSASLPFLLHATCTNATANENAHPITTTIAEALHTDSAVDTAKEVADPLHFAGLEERFVVAGGGTSAVLEQGNVRLFGSLLPLLATHIRNNVLSVSTDREIGEVNEDVTVQNALRKYNQSIVVENIDGVAIGHDHVLLLHRRPVQPLALHTATESANTNVIYEDVIVAIGSDSHGQCSGARAAATALGVPVITPSELSLVPSPATNGATFLISTHAGDERTEPSRDVTPFGSHAAPRILKLAAGLRHSAAITADGRLVTWGDNRHGQCLSGETTDAVNPVPVAWSPPNGAKVVDVACGAKFTIVIDDLGVVYSLGSPLGVTAVARSNRQEGQEGLERSLSVPVVVSGLPKDVRWQRVTCGWSHVVLRGLSATMDRKLEFYAWGKQNLSQFVSSDFAAAPLTERRAVEALLQDVADSGSEEVTARNDQNYADSAAPTNPVWEATGPVRTVGKADAALLAPRPLAPLPEGHSIAEVWCGSEYTVVADEAGGLWACGWNEHGNLGVGSPSSHLANQPNPSGQAEVVQQWARVQGCVDDGKCNGTGGLQLSHVWEGAVACGGGHVLCLP